MRGIGKSVEVFSKGGTSAISGLHTFLLRDLSSKIVSGYKGYIHSIGPVKDQLQTKATGLKVYGVSKKQLATIQIPLPPTQAEQRAIATALGEADAWIRGLEELLAKKRRVKEGVMGELLRPRAGWREVTLRDVLRFQVGFPFGSEYFNKRSEGVRLIKNRDLRSRDSITYYSGPYEEKLIVQYGDVLVGMDGDFMPSVWQQENGLLNQRIGRILPSQDVDLVFLFYLIQRPLKELEEITSATTVKHLSHQDIEDMVLYMPDLSIQKEISQALATIDAELQTLQTKLTKARALKAAMMQELLTGKIRLV